MNRRRFSYGLVLIVACSSIVQRASTAPPVATDEGCGGAPCTWVAFGPQTIARIAGQPVTQTVTFAVANPATQYQLHVTNDMVSSADVWVNGVHVLSPNDLNQTVTTIDKVIQLQPQNTITAVIRSGPATSLIVEIIGTDTDAPRIEYTETPPANAAGWHTTDVLYSFTCSDPTSGIAFCSPPAALTSEGADLQVTGVARDVAGNTTTIAFSSKIDKTPPAIAITAPVEGSAIGGVTAEVSGTVSDALSGLVPESVLCNGVAASLSATQFTCVVPLAAGSNEIAVRASDVAGNSSTAVVHVSTEPVSPTQHLRLLDVTPGSITAGQVTDVRITAQVDVHPSLMAETVALHRFDPETRQTSRLSQMFDDGTHGDELRGDNIFTITLAINESPSIVFLEASASYRDLSLPVFSNPERLFVQDTQSAEDALAELSSRLEQNNIAGALEFFAPSRKTTDFLYALNGGQRARLVGALRSLQLANATPDVRVYRAPWLEADGSTTDIEFGLSRDPIGRWVIFSW